MTPEELKLLKIKYLNEWASGRESVSKTGKDDMKSVRSFKSHKIETQISTKKHSFRKPDIISPEKKI